MRDPQAVELDTVPAGTRETVVGLPLLRSMLADGKLAHHQADPLTDQLAEARVTKSAGGALSLVAGPRSDAVRATAWALHSLVQDPPLIPAIW